MNTFLILPYAFPESHVNFASLESDGTSSNLKLSANASLSTEVEMEFQGSLELINYYVKNLPFNQET